MIVQAIVALLQQAPEIDRATVRSSSFIARPPITSSRVSGGSNATRRRSRGDPSSVFLSTLAALSAAFFLRHRRRARQAKNISRADRRHAEGSTCCCLLPHHPHSRPPVRLHHPGSRHHPARRQCPRNCDARTAFSGRAEKKRRGSPGGFPRRLEADVQCSRSMHRNDRRSLKRLAEIGKVDPPCWCPVFPYGVAAVAAGEPAHSKPRGIKFLHLNLPASCRKTPLFHTAFRRPKSIGFIGLPKTDFGRVIPYTRP